MIKMLKFTQDGARIRIPTSSVTCIKETFGPDDEIDGFLLGDQFGGIWSPDQTIDELVAQMEGGESPASRPEMAVGEVREYLGKKVKCVPAGPRVCGGCIVGCTNCRIRIDTLGQCHKHLRTDGQSVIFIEAKEENA